MVVLALDTATRQGSAALWMDGACDAAAGDPARTHGELLRRPRLVVGGAESFDAHGGAAERDMGPDPGRLVEHGAAERVGACRGPPEGQPAPRGRPPFAPLLLAARAFAGDRDRPPWRASWRIQLVVPNNC